MQYRPFGKTGFQASALGFGCMRLPQTEAKQIDEEHATRMVHYAIDHGVNYFDTGYPYHGGESERFLGRALQGGWRQRMKLATKMPVWAAKEAADFDRLLNEQLEKLQTEHIDFYLLHGLRKKRWLPLEQLGIQRWLDKAKADGRIGGTGFSFHDQLDTFKRIIDSYNWDMCQIQYNYMNEEVQAGTEGLNYAAAKGVAVVVMEPLLGGKLAAPPPPAIQAIWDSSGQKRTPADWALQWLWNKPQVSVVLSGMSSLQQMEENVASAERAAVGSMDAAGLAVVAEVTKTLEMLRAVPCTACEYCMPCPNGVDIPRNFTILNHGLMFGDMAGARKRYTSFMRDQDATVLGSSCIGCLDCEDQCPQSIRISEWQPYLHEVLANGREYRLEDAPKG